MRFWDSSALVLLQVEQSASSTARGWLASDGEVAIWTLTGVEIVSAIHRLKREGLLDDQSASELERTFEALLSKATIVTDVDAVKLVARRLLRVHELRAADALQLAAALAWAGGEPGDRTIHTLDGRLAVAALREGFTCPTA